MIDEPKYACAGQMAAEVLMIVISLFIVCIIYYGEVIGFKKLRVNPQDANLLQAAGYSLFLPLLSYMFSQAKQYNSQNRAQNILIWMVLVEIIRIRGDPIFTWRLGNSAEQLGRLIWVFFLVNTYTPFNGTRVCLFILCVYFAASEVLKGIYFCKAKDSYLIGKNPILIHNYMKRVMLNDHLSTTPMSSCDYIVMGEENHEINVGNHGYLLREKKPNTKGILTVGRVFQLNSPEDEAFTSKNPYWRDTCVSLALAKLLRHRFSMLPLDEAGCRKALDFVLEGLIGYIGGHQDIPTEGRNRGKREPAERVFAIIQEELKFVSEFVHIKVPIYRYFKMYILVDYIGVLIIYWLGSVPVHATITLSTSWKSLVERDPKNHCFLRNFKHGSYVVLCMSILDMVITYALYIACVYVQMSAFKVAYDSNVRYVRNYIKDPAKWYKSHTSWEASTLKKLSPLAYYNKKSANWEEKESRKSLEKINKIAREVHSSILDMKRETILFCIKVGWSKLVRLPKWINRIIPRKTPTVFHSTDAKEAILRSFTNSGGELSNGVSSLKNHRMEHLNGACPPNGSGTETILVWHIGTTLFHHEEASCQQSRNTNEEPSNSKNKELEVALELSDYCHYLVEYHPELLPESVEWTRKMHESVIKEIISIDPSSDKKPQKAKLCIKVLQTKWDENSDSVLGKGVKLAKELKNYADVNGAPPVWAMLADFWAEMMLFIAPSDNVEGHKEILDRKELITQLWALLTHAGILSRPKIILNLPSPWREMTDAATGKIYFWNPQTGVMQDNRPIATSATAVLNTSPTPDAAPIAPTAPSSSPVAPVATDADAATPIRISPKVNRNDHGEISIDVMDNEPAIEEI